MITTENVDLDRLNSLTKYGSIPTYHTLENRKLTETIRTPFRDDDEITISEKIDGANGRKRRWPRAFTLGAIPNSPTSTNTKHKEGAPPNHDPSLHSV